MTLPGGSYLYVVIGSHCDLVHSDESAWELARRLQDAMIERELLDVTDSAGVRHLINPAWVAQIRQVPIP